MTELAEVIGNDFRQFEKATGKFIRQEHLKEDDNLFVMYDLGMINMGEHSSYQYNLVVHLKDGTIRAIYVSYLHIHWA